MSRLFGYVVQLTLSANEHRKINLRVPNLPLRCKDITVSTDQDVEFTASFVDIGKFTDITDDGTGYSTETNPTRIQGDLQLTAVGNDDFFELESDPILEFWNQASVTAKVNIKIAHFRK